MSKKDNVSNINIQSPKNREIEERTKLLRSIGVKDYFDEGSIRIDWKTCRGIECRLCIDACPTNSLYWKEGEIGIVRELCVFCVACVGVCIVDDCIQLCRKRLTGETERFSNPKETLILLRNINSRKAVQRIKSRIRSTE